jgi:hypothetical protein
MTNDGSGDFLDLVMTIFHLSESRIIELWVMICWSLRNARNKWVFENVQDHPTQILHSARTLLQDFQNQHLLYNIDNGSLVAPIPNAMV